MTPAQRGGYIMLLAFMWNTEDCALLDDEDYLARLSGLDNSSLTLVRSCFIKHGSNRNPKISHKRLLIERSKQDDWRDKCSKAGKASAKARSNYRSTSVQQKANISTPTPTPTSISLKEDMGAAAPTPSKIAKDFFAGKWEPYLGKLLEAGCPEALAHSEFQNFVDYWTEPNKSGTKVRWEQQPTFDVGRRLKTWFRNYNKFNPITESHEYTA